jgi:signal peptidase I
LRAVTATVVISLTGIAAFVLLAWLQSGLLGGDDVLVLLVWVTLLGEVFLFWLIIKVTVRTTLLRASLVWLVGMIAVAISLATVFLVIRPFVFEAFVVGNNSMAPTLVGWHKTEACPHCGHVLIVPTQGPDEPANPFQQDELAICSFCFRTSRVNDPSSDLLGPDRFVANKLLRPRRWDLVVFRYPHNPSIKLVKRLLGLPGEKVFIKESAVWVNGTKLAPPQEIAHLQYPAGDEMPVHASGSPDEPWELKENECIVLGDFTQRSADSRPWGPVPFSSIEGVATARYWPLSRWHVWR